MPYRKKGGGHGYRNIVSNIASGSATSYQVFSSGGSAKRIARVDARTKYPIKIDTGQNALDLAYNTTNFYLNAGNELSLTISGSTPEALSYWSSSSGAIYPDALATKVGIGTTAPVKTLDVSGAISAAHTTPTNAIYYSNGQPMIYYGGAGAPHMNLYSGDTSWRVVASDGSETLMTLTDGGSHTGRLSLGSAAIDSAKLTVVAPSVPQLILANDGTNYFSLTEDGNYLNFTANAAGTATMSLRDNGNTYFNGQNIIFETSQLNYLQIKGTNTLGFGDGADFEWSASGSKLYLMSGTTVPSATPILGITQAGNVGIGTASPGKALDVRGGATFSGSIFASGSDLGGYISRTDTNEMAIYAGDGTKGIHLAPSINYLSAPSTRWQVQSDFRVNSTKQLQFGDHEHLIQKSGDNLLLQTRLTTGQGIVTDSYGDTTFKSNGTARMTILSGGNVGIGTAVPAEKLSVVGKMVLNDGDDNVVIGTAAGEDISSGVQNILIGTNAGANLTDHSNNVFVGHNAGKFATSAEQNIAIGYQALGAGTLIGDENVFIGQQAGKSADAAAGNVGIGQKAAAGITSGVRNAFLGFEVGGSVTTGSYNTFIGASVGVNTTLGNYNTAVGDGAFYSNVSGNYNTAIGRYALYGMLPADGEGKNTAVGYRAGYSVTEGTGNVFLGYDAGQDATATDDNKLFIANAAGKPLIGGTFSGDEVHVYGDLWIGSRNVTAAPATALHVDGYGSNDVAIFESADTKAYIEISDYGRDAGAASMFLIASSGNGVGFGESTVLGSGIYIKDNKVGIGHLPDSNYGALISGTSYLSGTSVVDGYLGVGTVDNAPVAKFHVSSSRPSNNSKPTGSLMVSGAEGMFMYPASFDAGAIGLILSGGTRETLVDVTNSGDGKGEYLRFTNDTYQSRTYIGANVTSGSTFIQTTDWYGSRQPFYASGGRQHSTFGNKAGRASIYGTMWDDGGPFHEFTDGTSMPGLHVGSGAAGATWNLAVGKGLWLHDNTDDVTEFWKDNKGQKMLALGSGTYDVTIPGGLSVESPDPSVGGVHINDAAVYHVGASGGISETVEIMTGVSLTTVTIPAIPGAGGPWTVVTGVTPTTKSLEIKGGIITRLIE